MKNIIVYVLYQLNPRNGAVVDFFEYSTREQAEKELAWYRKFYPEYKYRIGQEEQTLIYEAKEVK